MREKMDVWRESWHFDSIRILHLSLAVLLSTLGKRLKFAPGSALIQDYLYYNKG